MSAKRNLPQPLSPSLQPAELLAEIARLRQQMVELEQQVEYLRQSGRAERSQHLAQKTATERVKDEFLAILSHELRSPLNPILGWAKLLRAHRFDPDVTQRALGAIERNAKLQVQLIEDLLDVSEVLQGKLQLNVEQVNLTQVVEAALKSVKLAAQSKQITLRKTLSASVWVAGDAAKLQQVVWNLLSNAVKFTPDGGQVQVSLEQILGQPDHPESRLAQICVSDSGRGINPQFLPYMFDHFRQADSSITRQVGGLGLGLTIVRHLVELHGGMIDAESAGIDQGAVFSVTLPLLDLSLPVLPLPSPLPPRSIDQVRILLVEQNTDLRDYLALALETAGAELITAGSAGEALAKLSRLQPEIVVCKLNLPNVNGISLLRQIRSLMPELGGKIPAIALISHTGEYSQQEILAAGFQSYLSLPVEPEELIEAIHRLVHQVSQQP